MPRKRRLAAICASRTGATSSPSSKFPPPTIADATRVSPHIPLALSAAMVAIAAATRAPHQAATLFTAMPQEHQRGLGNWQAELATWPALFMSAHGAVHALAEACCAGLEVDAARMRANIDAHHRMLAAEAGAAPPDVDAAARQAAVTAAAQLEALATPRPWQVERNTDCLRFR